MAHVIRLSETVYREITAVKEEKEHTSYDSAVREILAGYRKNGLDPVDK